MSRDDPLGHAIHDHYYGDQDEPLIDQDGTETREQPIEHFYFGEFDPESDAGAWVASWLDGPLLDIGAGAGRDALYFQEQFETVAIEISKLPSPTSLGLTTSLGEGRAFAWTPVLCHPQILRIWWVAQDYVLRTPPVVAGGTYSPLTFNVPRFKRTSTGAPPSAAFCLRRRYR